MHKSIKTLQVTQEHGYGRLVKPTKRPRRKHKIIITELARKLNTIPKHIPGVLSLAHSVRLKAMVHRRNVKEISLAFMSIPSLRNCCVDILAEDSIRTAKTMNGRKYNQSELMKKDFEALRTIDFTDIVSEFKNKFPDLFKQVTSLMNCVDTAELYQQAMPRLTMVYSIIMFTRNNELSRVQRTMSACMCDCLCEQKMYDRLNRLGICLCYGTSLKLLDIIGADYLDVLVRALGEGNVLRFIADNIDFMIGVHTETKDRHKHMKHMTGCAAFINKSYFENMPNTPEIPLDKLTFDDVTLKPKEYKIMRDVVVKLVVDNVTPPIPSLKFLKDVVPETYQGPESYRFVNKTEVVPLPVLDYNENRYQDTVKILDCKENIITKIHKKRGDKPKKYQDGGDQLTRERFSGAKLLRLGNPDPAARFEHLLPFTFEFLHLGFNFLEKACINRLYNKTGIAEVGTLKGEITRTFRNDFNTDVIKAYDADKNFVLDFTAALQVEGIKHFFGIHDINQGPTKNIPPTFSSKKEKKEWVFTVVGEFVDKYIFPCWTGNDTIPSVTTGI